MGLPKVVEKLKTKYALNPLATPALGGRFGDKPGFNAVQEAIRGGFAESVKILTDSNYDLVIDSLGRTVKDYINMNGSPIRPKDAMDVLGIDTASSQTPIKIADDHRLDMGWNETTSYETDETCDLDVIHGGDLSRQDFYNEYFMTGRPFMLRNVVPFMLRNVVPDAEVLAYTRERWSTTERFHPDTHVSVGPTVYPSMTAQHGCDHRLSIAQIENITQCQSLPGVPMVHARHPKALDWDELLPMYDGNIFHKDGGYRLTAKWFGPRPGAADMSWQLFLGGDGSGATFHWHGLAFNTLYAGIKQWKITPPK